MKKRNVRPDPPRDRLAFQRENLAREMARAVERAVGPEPEPEPPTPAELRANPEWVDLSSRLLAERRRCERCGKGGFRHVHHIEPLWKAPHRLLDVTNLQVLCPHCHAMMEWTVRKPAKRSEMHPLYLAREKVRHLPRAYAVTGKRIGRPGV